MTPLPPHLLSPQQPKIDLAEGIRRMVAVTMS